jgi:adenosylhomocysteine nucleosidase
MSRDLFLVGLALAASACAGPAPECRPQRVAVLGAMPSELAPLVERARVDETVVVDGHSFRVGELGGVPVVLGMTRIGMENARATARAVIQRFQVTGMVVSGVAGSQLRIGDVAVPARWLEPDGTAYPADPRWLALAEDVARSRELGLERCAAAKAAPGGRVCLGFEPAISVGDTGHSGDSFGGAAFGCDPEGGGVYGCDIEPRAALAGIGKLPPVPASARAPEAAPLPYVKDMETAAIASEARARGIPFVAFRAASDGSEDPLGLTEPFAQFFVYYELAARNAATATGAFLERVAASDPCARGAQAPASPSRGPSSR